ncbi:hypothetical protein M527_06955 [Sphingobium indicum IP26]|uniref:Uncharacterized protein n=1 Tax=Sphingobium indicum F2 TaxID=1450518 RepID=A0A8E1C2X3_9SPHN|nr:hypothetical protein M527_06955 [Sphingobium indicum IP26]EQB04987.1 hypothetical protein L286_09470 [Sphingobium sp. HDIP04]KER36654.1 hypothetical protein AL00_09260 [Sphingobium indicum F2]
MAIYRHIVAQGLADGGARLPNCSKDSAGNSDHVDDSVDDNALDAFVGFVVDIRTRLSLFGLAIQFSDSRSGGLLDY